MALQKHEREFAQEMARRGIAARYLGKTKHPRWEISDGQRTTTVRMACSPSDVNAARAAVRHALQRLGRTT